MCEVTYNGIHRPLVGDPEPAPEELLSKETEHWAYENEWRVLRSGDDPYHPVPGKIREVVMGCRFERGLQENILRRLAPPGTKFRAAKLQPNPDEIILEDAPTEAC